MKLHVVDCSVLLCSPFLPDYYDRLLNKLQSNLHITVSALVAAAVVWMSELPAKLNPIILPLMASIKREQVLFFVHMLTNTLCTV